ncbi:MmyB family transcriptional regulator [Amycolatopsis rifamycinica]|uniref:MmyB-like transcription regulator ligand binding domain-containing protein n=1 Tax=Amycolatopsis rifamycinica TaxID=287986 RepID=A0A066UCP7_9PSEU|nr:hypothetical protein [Amycolatopsis rifamycinica]KDN21919.1 hypothetical protein DV20_13470 [Amycolatopsis rifamycinica]
MADAVGTERGRRCSRPPPCADHPADEQLLDLVTNLRAASAAFDEQWAAGRAAVHCSERKNIRHPSGDLVLDCDVRKVAGSDTNVLA